MHRPCSLEVRVAQPIPCAAVTIRQCLGDELHIAVSRSQCRVGEQWVLVVGLRLQKQKGREARGRFSVLRDPLLIRSRRKRQWYMDYEHNEL